VEGESGGVTEHRDAVDLLLRHGRIITMDGQRRILRDGAIAVRDGRIVAIGPDAEVAPGVDAKVTRDLAGALVHPGFVDAHAHTGMDLIRGLTPDGSRDWTAVETPYFHSLTRDDEYLGTLLACMEMVANGITTYADTGSSFDLAATAEAIDTVGMKGIPGVFVADMPLESEGLDQPLPECLQRLETQLDCYPFHGPQRVRCAVTIAGMGTCSDELLKQAKVLADERRVPVIMHQSWGEEEVEAALEQYGKRPVEHLADVGILAENLTLVHMIRANDAEVALVAAHGARVIHCPSASIRRSMGAFRVGRFPEMLAAGIPVALGSDGHSGKHDVARQAYLAATVHREMRNAVPTISAQTALEMATINGAIALGMEQEIGSLEPGKRADVVVHARNRPELRPSFSDPVANLVYHALAQGVETVLVDGEVVLDGGQFTRFDAEAAYARLDAVAAEIEQRLSPPRGEGDWPIV
jgi:cytosine/adenosine deaminase-related metal-dependent hydrolase